MTPRQFDAAIATTQMKPGRTRDACYLVLVRGFTPYRASLLIGVSQGAISRALKLIPTKFCKTCKQPITTDRQASKTPRSS